MTVESFVIRRMLCVATEGMPSHSIFRTQRNEIEHKISWTTLAIFVVLGFTMIQQIESSVSSFEQLCLKPPYGGEGKLQGTTCTTTIRYKSRNDKEAEEYCKMISPYHLEKAIPGKPTTCVTELMFTCNGTDEINIDETCYVLKGYNKFGEHQNVCKHPYKLHTVGTLEELKWITVFLSKTDQVWIGNSGQATRFRRPIHPNKWWENVNTDDSRPILARLITGGRYFHRAGTLTYADPSEQHPFLCSREALIFEQGIKNLIDLVRHIGNKVVVAKDASGADRPFIVFNVYHAVRGNESSSNFDDFHKICQIFPNGYVASRFDFKDKSEYEKVMNEFHVPMRVSVSRHSSLNELPSCDSEKKFKNTKKFWNFRSMANERVAIPDDHWKQGCPDNMCADGPFTTAVMVREGYVDVPAMARYVVLCTFGNPPNLNPRDLDSMCSREAKYNPVKHQCECIDPNSDGRIQDPEKYANYPPGAVCMSCTSTVTTRTVVFILDSTGSVQPSGYAAEVEFAVKVFGTMKSVRGGVVVLSCPSFIGLKLDQYTGDMLKDWVQKQEYDDGITDTNQAYHLAEEMIMADQSNERILIVLSDGQPNNCVNEVYGSYPDETVAVAEKLRTSGIRIIFIQVGHEYDNYVYATMNNDLNSIVNVNDFTALDTSTLVEIVNKICNPVE